MSGPSILITGASSGLGAALAEAYAAPGTRLWLGGRDPGRLGVVAQRCRDKGAEVDIGLVDVTDRRGMADWVENADRVSPLSLVIANAGISGGTGQALGETAQQTRDIFAANLDGVLNCVLPAIPLMRARRHGQIALMASLAAFRGMPGAPAYSASKAAVRLWGEGLRGWLAADGVTVSVLCPGFVATPLTARNRFPMPFLLSAERAARIMRSGLDAKRARIAFPWPLAAAVWLLAALPPGWTDAILTRAPRKR